MPKHRDILAKLRREYTQRGLNEAGAPPHPVDQFASWLQDAVDAGLREPNAMTLATATAMGAPSARIVLLKDFDNKGFVFFTNYESRKGRELAKNPRAALVFHWNELERQVRIEGAVKQLPRAASAAYFASRPRDAQIGAWASQQSGLLRSRAALEENYRRLSSTFKGRSVPAPPFWGGYNVSPAVIEFWQGRENRLHDRLVYGKSGSKWTLSRLSP